MIRIKYGLISFILTAVMIIGCLSYSAYEVVAEQNVEESSGFWSEISEEMEQTLVANDADSVILLLDMLSELSAIDEDYLNTVLTAGESYSSLPISEKNRISADSVRLLEREYNRASIEVTNQANSMPSIGEVCLFSGDSEATIEKVLKLSYYSSRFPYDIKKTLPIDRLNQLEKKLTRVVYADSVIVDNAKIVHEFSPEQGTNQALIALEAYQQLGNNVDLLSSSSVEKLSSAIGNMVYSNTAFDNSNFCLMFTAGDLSKDTAPTINVSTEKLNLTQKQLNSYKSALKPNTILGNVNKLNVIASGEEVTSVSAPIAVTIPVSPSASNRNPYVIAYDNLGNASILYDTDDNDNTITVMMTALDAKYAVAYDMVSGGDTDEYIDSNNGTGYDSGSNGGSGVSSNLEQVSTASNSTALSSKNEDTNSSGDSTLTTSSKLDENDVTSSDSSSSSELTSSTESDKSSSETSSKVTESSSDTEKEGSISSNEADGKPTLENMPAKVEHNNRMVLIVILIGAVALLVGILVIMFIPKSGMRDTITGLFNKKKK